MLEIHLALASLVLLLGSAGSPGNAQTSLVLAPEAGTTRTKVIERREQFALEELEVSIDGKDMASAFRSVDFFLDNHLQIEVRDTYKALADGKLQTLERHFERLELSSEQALNARSLPPGDAPDEEARRIASSPLEKRSVSFQRNAAGKMVASGIPGQPALEADWIAGLRAELDARAFLPLVPVETNDVWKVDPALAGPIFAPCGDLRFRAKDGTPSSISPFGAGGSGGAGGGPADSYEGLIEARFEGVVQQFGSRVARIHLTVKISATRDLSKRGHEFQPLFPAPVKFQPERLEGSSFFEGDGLLEWNLDTQVLQSFELTGEGGISILQTGKLETGALSQELHQKLGLRGPQTLSISCGN